MEDGEEKGMYILLYFIRFIKHMDKILITQKFLLVAIVGREFVKCYMIFAIIRENECTMKLLLVKFRQFGRNFLNGKAIDCI